MHKSFDNFKLTLLNVGYAELNEKWDYDNVISPYSRLYLITSGSAKVYHNDTTFNLKPGYLYLIPSYTYSRYKCETKMCQYYISAMDEIGQSFSIYNFYEFQFEVRAIPGDETLFERLLTLNPNRNLVREDPKFYDNRPTLQSFIERNNELSFSALLETQGIIKILLSRFLKNETAGSKKTIWNERVLETVRYIHENLPQAISVEDLARRCHLTPDHFSRIFLESTGQRPIKYIQHKRIERAQVLLTTTSNSFQTIAEKVGLENISYFSRLFKRATGKTPREFRREHWI